MPVCKKCNQSFPHNMIMDGKRRNLSKRSYCLECSPYKQNNKRSLILYDDVNQTKLCSICQKQVPISNFYVKANSVLFSYCISCEKRRKLIKQREFKQKCVDYKGGKCSKCGYDKCLSALDFHHLDPNKKDFGISANSRIFTDHVKQELDKCILVCANCHRELHDVLP